MDNVGREMEAVEILERRPELAKADLSETKSKNNKNNSEGTVKVINIF